MTRKEPPPWALRLRAEREARLWTQKDMAVRLRAASDDQTRARLPSQASIIRRIVGYEAGDHKPGGIYAELYCRAFGLTRTELLDNSDARASSVLDPTDVIAPSAGIAPVRLAHRGPVAPELVSYFREQLPGHYRADMFLGPHHLIPTVLAQVQLIGQLVGSAEDGVRQDLLGIGVAYASLLGWLHQDAGDMRESGQWRAAALGMAHRSADRHLISYALSNLAMHSADLRNGVAVVDFAQAALADDQKLSPKVRVLALQHKAHGYSLLRERTEVDHLLDQAAPLVALVDDDYPWGNSSRRTPSYIEVQRATCYGRMGLASQAANLWEQILGAMPEDARRDAAVYRTRQAVALAGVEPERVVSIAADVADLVQETGSARLRRELLTLPEHAAGWADTVHGRALNEILAGLR